MRRKNLVLRFEFVSCHPIRVLTLWRTLEEGRHMYEGGVLDDNNFEKRITFMPETLISNYIPSTGPGIFE